MRLIKRLGNTCGVTALLIALGAGPLFAQTATQPPPHDPPSGAPQEGIKVHGDWTLTMRNPDGTVAAQHEFKNALIIDGGGRALAQLLGGTALAGQWVVHLQTSPANACNDNFPLCEISEGILNLASDSRDLTKTAPLSGPDAYKLVLRGSVRVRANTAINMVQTLLTSCPATTPPASCVSAMGSVFSQRTLSPGVPVVADQLVEVKVVISFS